MFPLQYIASRHSRWKVWLHLVRRPTAMGPRLLLVVTSLYPDVTDSFSMQMMQSCREGTQHTLVPACLPQHSHATTGPQYASAGVREEPWLCQKGTLGHQSHLSHCSRAGDHRAISHLCLEGLTKKHRPRGQKSNPIVLTRDKSQRAKGVPWTRPPFSFTKQA